MKKRTLLIIGLLTLGIPASAQFRAEQPQSYNDVSKSVMRPSEGLLFGWLDPSRLSMHHSYSLSYSSFGGHGVSVGTYTNSLFYKFSDPLDVRFDISLMHSPYSSFGNSKDFSGIFLSRAQLNYRPSDNMWLQIQFRQLPPMYWWDSGFTSGLPSGMYDGTRWDQREEDR